MIVCQSGRAKGLAGLVLVAVLGPVAAFAQSPASPRYTYLGAGWDGGDSRCAVEPGDEGVSGFTAEGSIGLFDAVHLLGTAYSGETDGSNVDVTCYEVGAGVTWGLTESADVVLRGYYVSVDTDVGDADGFEPELLVRYAISDRVEVDLGMAYYDMSPDEGEDFDDTEVRLGVVYNVLPWLAVRAGGTIFDDDSTFNLGVRAYLGGNLF